MCLANMKSLGPASELRTHVRLSSVLKCDRKLEAVFLLPLGRLSLFLYRTSADWI